MKIHHHFYFTRLLAAAVVLAPALAMAHPGHGTGSFVSGFTHPLHGFDHLLAMLAVGLWAAQLGGRARWVVPASFVGVMSLGGALALVGVGLPLAEQGIVASVLILGLLIAATVRLPLAASAALVGLFALCHGHAHGVEMPASAAGAAYGLGFVGCTALLHVLGMGLGLFLQHTGRRDWLRATGVSIGLAGLLLVGR